MNISLIQPLHDDLLSKNQRIERVYHAIKNIQNTDFIVLPELWNTGFFSYDNYKKNSEAENGETVTMLRDAAREKNAYICTGSIIESSGDKLYNTVYMLSPQGKIIGKYRKIHLFGNEKKYLCRGGKISVCDTDFGRIGLSICYDLRFPELYRQMTADNPPEILVNCAAWPMSRLEHWKLLSRARALENQAIFIACSCRGKNNGGHFCGTGLICAPKGKILCEASDSIISHYIDIQSVYKYRKEFSALKDRIL